LTSVGLVFEVGDAEVLSFWPREEMELESVELAPESENLEVLSP